MERMFRKTVNAFLILGMALVVGYAVYAVGIPLSFYEVRTATVRCPTTRTPILSFTWGGKVSINNVEARCDYATAGVPQPVRNDTIVFIDLTNQVGENDSFICRVAWKSFPELPYALRPRDGKAELDRESCRLASEMRV